MKTKLLHMSIAFALVAFISISITLEGVAAATKYYVDTFATASGYLGTHCLNDPSQYCRPQGELYAGTNYVFCKRWGDEVSNGKDYNHWWMLTDLDEVYPGKSGRAYVSAYYLSRWGNDEAKDNNGIDLPDC